MQNINDGKVPPVGTVVDQVRRSTFQAALEKALQRYCNGMDLKVKYHGPIEEDVIETHHTILQAEAKSLFEENALFKTDLEQGKMEVI